MGPPGLEGAAGSQEVGHPRCLHLKSTWGPGWWAELEPGREPGPDGALTLPPAPQATTLGLEGRPGTHTAPLLKAGSDHRKRRWFGLIPVFL